MDSGQELARQVPLLQQAHDRALRLGALLRSQEADAIRHSRLAEKLGFERSTHVRGASDAARSDASAVGIEMDVHRRGVELAQMAANSAERLIDGLSRALREENERL